MDIFGRVTVSYDVFSLMTEKLTENCDKFVVYEHNENVLNVHVHFLIKGLKCGTDSLKNWIRKTTERSYKATDWSFKTKYKPDKGSPERSVDDSCITYMSKGKLTPSYVSGYSAIDIESYRLMWLDYKRQAKQQSLTSYIVKETQKASKLRQDEMITEICKRLDNSTDKRPRMIVQFIRQVVIIENKTVLGRYKCRDYFDAVLSRIDPPSWELSMTLMCTDKMNL